jgi:hypothetical protein
MGGLNRGLNGSGLPPEKMTGSMTDDRGLNRLIPAPNLHLNLNIRTRHLMAET